MIQQLLGSEQPPVQTVVLAEDGTARQLSLDMTPAKAEVSKLLGGTPTFIGQFAELEVMIVKVFTPTEAQGLTTAKMPSPFVYNEADPSTHHRGPILLYRCDENADPKNFTLAEWQAFVAAQGTSWEVVEPVAQEEEGEAASEGESEEESESESDGDFEEEEEGSDDDEGEMTEEQMALFRAVIETFIREHGRQPEEAELIAIMAKMNEEIFSCSGESSDDDDDDEDDDDDDDDDGEEGALAEEEQQQELPTPAAKVSAVKTEETPSVAINRTGGQIAKRNKSKGRT